MSDSKRGEREREIRTGGGVKAVMEAKQEGKGDEHGKQDEAQDRRDYEAPPSPFRRR